METELRRCRSNLGSLGSGVIVFTLWKLISLLVQKTNDAAPAAVTLPELSPGLLVSLILAAMVLAILNILLRFHIGRAARAEAAEKRKGARLCGLCVFHFRLADDRLPRHDHSTASGRADGEYRFGYRRVSAP